MKKMLIPIIITIIGYTNTLAQKVSFGAKLGFTNSILLETVNGQAGVTSSINNVDIRLYADLPYGKMTVQPGIGLYLKGGFGADQQYSTSATTFATASNELLITYIEIPVNVLYNIRIKPGKFFIGGGPYLAIAASALNKQHVTNVSYTNATTSETSTQNNMTFGSGQNDLQRLDVGINLVGGFRFNNRIDLGIEYGQGFTNIYNIPNFTAHNVNGSITVGYFFR